MRKAFYDIFFYHPDGSLEPIHQIQIGGVQFGPGVRFGKGVAFSGIDLSNYLGKDFEVEIEGGVWKLIGVYG